MKPKNRSSPPDNDQLVIVGRVVLADLRQGGGGEEGEICPMCESIGHRPLRGRCPKGP